MTVDGRDPIPPLIKPESMQSQHHTEPPQRGTVAVAYNNLVPLLLQSFDSGRASALLSLSLHLPISIWGCS